MLDPTSSSSAAESPLTVPSVPTGMKAGVSTVPRGVEKRPVLARPLAAVWSKPNTGG